MKNTLLNTTTDVTINATTSATPNRPDNRVPMYYQRRALNTFHNIKFSQDAVDELDYIARNVNISKPAVIVGIVNHVLRSQDLLDVILSEHPTFVNGLDALTEAEEDAFWDGFVLPKKVAAMKAEWERKQALNASKANTETTTETNTNTTTDTNLEGTI